jgi:hypothetical protein
VEAGQGQWRDHQLASGHPLGKDTRVGVYHGRMATARGRHGGVQLRRELYGCRRRPGCVPIAWRRGGGEAPIDLKETAHGGGAHRGRE